MKTNVAILEDHPVVVSGIIKMFEHDETITITHSWSNAVSFLHDLGKDIEFDVLLLDILLPDHHGDWVIQQLRKTHSGIKILAMSVLDSAISANTMLRLGALGYITKHAAPEEWRTAILTVRNGERYLEPTLKEKILNLGDGRTREASVKTTLSPREKEVLQLIALGKSKKEIADELGISSNTVKQYQYNISLKLEVKSTAALVGYALRAGLAQ